MIRAAFLLVVGLAACAPPGPSLTTHSALLPLGGPCPTVASAGSEFTAEASSLRLTVSGPGMASALSAEGSIGELSVDAVPVGTERVVGLFGLVGAVPLWRGVARGVTVERDVPSNIDVLMTRLGDLTCARGADTDKRVFHTATVLNDGRILVIGGAKTSTPQTSGCPGCRVLDSTASASLYDPHTGAFSATGPLTVARMLHTATKLADGRVVVMGGARSAFINSDHDFPIIPIDALNGVEVFDPASQTFQSSATDPAGGRVFASATLTLDDEVIITGGIPQGLTGVAERNDLRNALSSTTICGGAVLACRAGPDMGAHRAGHLAFTLEPDGVFVMGGSIDAYAATGTAFRIEALRDGTGFQPLAVAAMTAERNFFFAATAQYIEPRVLSAGGLTRNADGTFALATSGAGGAVIVLDLTSGASGGIVTGDPGSATGLAMATKTPRFFGTAAPLPGRTRAVIAGGFSDFLLTPSALLELYDQTKLEVTTPATGGVSKVLRQARGGLVAAASGDGTVVFFGGETDGTPVETAEIFADPVTPPGVAE